MGGMLGTQAEDVCRKAGRGWGWERMLSRCWMLGSGCLQPVRLIPGSGLRVGVHDAGLVQVVLATDSE